MHCFSYRQSLYISACHHWTRPLDCQLRSVCISQMVGMCQRELCANAIVCQYQLGMCKHAGNGSCLVQECMCVSVYQCKCGCVSVPVWVCFSVCQWICACRKWQLPCTGVHVCQCVSVQECVSGCHCEYVCQCVSNKPIQNKAQEYTNLQSSVKCLDLRVSMMLCQCVCVYVFRRWRLPSIRVRGGRLPLMQQGLPTRAHSVRQTPWSPLSELLPLCCLLHI